ncbi:thiolase family protein [Nocardia fusca]|uniref:thiolase family protein n=1 Tax=Nocardia fusca TaxID=941183 RepID=UPI0007A73B9F|nr:thiolase family protein [Nocardia fusca]
MTRSAVIVDAIRSPMAKGKAPENDRPGGALSGLHPADLLGQMLAALFARTDVDPGVVDDVITGCVTNSGEQTGTIGRWAWLGAGLPEHVPSVMVNRACGSSQQAADFAAQAVIAGACDVVVACGVESMSRVPMFSARMGADPFGPAALARYAPGMVPQGVAAELVAARWNLDRQALDEYAAASHTRAAATDFGGETVPVTLPGGAVVDADETIRPGTTAEKLAQLGSSFRSEEMTERFPEIGWHITAGNSSQLTDGASAVLIMTEERAAALGLKPRARFHAFGLASDDPITMLTGPIPATRKALERSGLGIDDLDHIEVNEAFASVPLAWRTEFDADPARVNPRGGAISLGHPLGASGARLLTTMLNGLEATGGRYGLQTMCEAGGMANATIIERL